MRRFVGGKTALTILRNIAIDTGKPYGRGGKKKSVGAQGPKWQKTDKLKR